MTERKLFMGLRGDQRFAYADTDTLLVWDDELGLCSVDETKPLREQFLVPVNEPVEP